MNLDLALKARISGAYNLIYLHGVDRDNDGQLYDFFFIFKFGVREPAHRKFVAHCPK